MSTIADFVRQHLADTIEEEAYHVGSRANDDISIIMAVSIAVSLKRIANALEKPAAAPPRPQPSVPFAR